jgi:hypothetical protein
VSSGRKALPLEMKSQKNLNKPDELISSTKEILDFLKGQRNE